MQAPRLCTISLRSCLDRTTIFYRVTCDLPLVVCQSNLVWAHVPVSKIYAVLESGPRQLDGLFVPRPEQQRNVLNIFVGYNAPVFVNIYHCPHELVERLPGRYELPNNVRKWRKEFREHAQKHRYYLPSAWSALSIAEVDKVVAWALQDEACEIRIDMAQVGLNPWRRQHLWWTRNRVFIVQWLAHRLSVTQAVAESSFFEFRDLNSNTRENLNQFLQANMFHCYVK